MSHSQFHGIIAYTQTCMAQSLRQAYDYWQNQPGNYPRPERQSTRAQPPERSGVYQAGSRRSGPNHSPRQYTWHQRCERPIQLPPLSFPRYGPRRGMTDVSASDKPVTYAPKEEKTHASSRTQGADTRQGCPQRSGEYLAMPAIHRPQTVPAYKINRTSVANRKYRRNARGIASVYRR